MASWLQARKHPLSTSRAVDQLECCYAQTCRAGYKHIYIVHGHIYNVCACILAMVYICMHACMIYIHYPIAIILYKYELNLGPKLSTGIRETSASRYGPMHEL